MLRIIVSGSAAAAQSYFTQHLARQDYYMEDQEVAGEWGGLGAALLGLEGTVDAERFKALTENRNPQTDGPLTVRTKPNRRVGFDLNFHVPKSVSVMHAWTNDAAIVGAVNRAVAETMAELEAQTQARVRVDGQNADRRTGNLIYASFTHFTSRPVDGIPDPHVHVHVYVPNATFDEVEGKWKAVELRAVHRGAPYYEAAFHNRLAVALQRLGYSTERKEKSFEIKGVPDEALREFSRRTARIEAKARKLGITHPKLKDRLGAATREGKRHDLTRAQLRRAWDARLKPEWEACRQEFVAYFQKHMAGRTAEERAKLIPLPERGTLPGKAELRAAHYALLHSFERASVVDEVRLWETAIRYAMGTVDIPLLKKALADHPDVIRKEVDGRRMVTTWTVYNEERAMIEWVRVGKGFARPLLPGYVPDAAATLNDEQRAAVRHVLESRDRVIGVRGKAGTGKTTAMREVLEGLRKNGEKVLVMAPGSETARDTMPKDGIEGACTVAMLLASPRLREENRGGVWWVDEAGLLSARTMVRLCKLAEDSEARLILTGDTGQHGPVERGDALRILEKERALEMATLSTVLRQKGAYKEAVELLAQGRVLEGMAKLDAAGHIFEIASAAERNRTLAARYVELGKGGKSVLIISPTRSEIEIVTEAVRTELKKDGKLKRDREVPTLRKIDFREAEKADARRYRTGWVVELRKPVPGHRAGDRLTVTDVGEGALRVRQPDGEEASFEAARWAGRFDVFEPGTIGVAVGERVRITQNGRSADGSSRLRNGTITTVAGFTPDGDIKISSGVVVGRDYGHLTYGYATTSQSAQSKSVDHVLVAQSSASLGAASRQQGYVTASRGKEGVEWYTDDKALLFEALMESSDRLPATELVRPQPPKEPSPPPKTSTFFVEPPPALDYLFDNAPKMPQPPPIERGKAPEPPPPPEREPERDRGFEPDL